jgi:hypothetical protein
MIPLLKMALDNRRYDLAAHILVFGMIKARQNDKRKSNKEREAGVLQPGAE